jgi:hypothetical protein
MKKFNVAICYGGLAFLAVAIIGDIMMGRYGTALAWIVAVGWCIKSLMEASDCNKLNDLASSAVDTANKAVAALGAALGGKVVCMGTVEVDKDGNPKAIKVGVNKGKEGKKEDGHGESDVPDDPDGKKVGKEDIPQAIVEALKGMALCTEEAMRYIGNGNGEFMVSHNGVELKMSIPEDAMKELDDIKNGRAPEKPEENKDDAAQS